MKAAKYVMLAGVAGFLFVGTLGFAQLGMSSDSAGHMSGCPFMGVPALCHMSQLEHAFTLQNMLTAAPFSSLLAFFVSLLLAISITLLAPFFWKSVGILFEPLFRPPSRTARSIPRHPLQEAFSNGVLNTKAF